MKEDQIGQGLAEYAMGMSLIVAFALVALLLLGPAVGRLLQFIGVQMNTSAVITGVIAERADHMGGNAVHVTVGVTRDSAVSVRDELSGETAGPVNCRGSCLIILPGVGPDAGTVTVTTETGQSNSAQYAAHH